MCVSCMQVFECVHVHVCTYMSLHVCMRVFTVCVRITLTSSACISPHSLWSMSAASQSWEI